MATATVAVVGMGGKAVVMAVVKAVAILVARALRATAREYMLLRVRSLTTTAHRT